MSHTIKLLQTKIDTLRNGRVRGQTIEVLKREFFLPRYSASLYNIVVHNYNRFQNRDLIFIHRTTPPETRSPGVINRSGVSVNLTPRGDLLQNTQSVTTTYTPYGTSASETELPDHMSN